MRRFRITSNAFAGAIELTYHQSGVLSMVVFTDDFSISRQKAIEHIPWSIKEVSERSWNEGTECVEVDYVVRFEDFWEAYQKKVNKLRAETLWNKLNSTDKVLALEGVKKYLRYLGRIGWRNQKDPDTWLRGKGWLDEYV